MGFVLELIAVALVLLFVFASTLLACLVYPFIWLSRLCFAPRVLTPPSHPLSAADDAVDAAIGESCLGDDRWQREPLMTERSHFN